MAILDWPQSLVPRKVTPEPAHTSTSPGRSITGFEQVSTSDAGYWSLLYEEIPLVATHQKRDWRSASVKLRGRVGIVRCPIFEKFPPTTVAAFAAPAALGATSIVLDLVSGQAPAPGMGFTVNERFYRITSATAATGSNWDCKVWPPLRGAVSVAASANFAKPTILCKLATDLQMQTGADDYAGRTLAKVEFVEFVSVPLSMTGSVPSMLQGETVHFCFNPAGGLPPYAFSSSGTLPPGVSFDETTGCVVGTVSAAGSPWSFTATVTDSAGAHVSLAFSGTTYGPSIAPTATAILWPSGGSPHLSWSLPTPNPDHLRVLRNAGTNSYATAIDISGPLAGSATSFVDATANHDTTMYFYWIVGFIPDESIGQASPEVAGWAWSTPAFSGSGSLGDLTDGHNIASATVTFNYPFLSYSYGHGHWDASHETLTGSFSRNFEQPAAGPNFDTAVLFFAVIGPTLSPPAADLGLDQISYSGSHSDDVVHYPLYAFDSSLVPYSDVGGGLGSGLPIEAVCGLNGDGQYSSDQGLPLTPPATGTITLAQADVTWTSS